MLFINFLITQNIFCYFFISFFESIFIFFFFFRPILKLFDKVNRPEFPESILEYRSRFSGLREKIPGLWKNLKLLTKRLSEAFKYLKYFFWATRVLKIFFLGNESILIFLRYLKFF